MYISSRQIVGTDLYSSESSGWGQILGVLVFIIGIVLAIVGVLGLVFYNKRNGAIYFIIAGAILTSQITLPTDIIGVLLILPMTYLVCGILLLIHNSKKPLPTTSQDACVQDNTLAQG